LDDLLGRTLAFEAPRSTSAYYVPSAALLRLGLPLVPRETAALKPDAVNYVFAGSELNQAYWVQRGEVDAGVFNDGDWRRTPASLRRELRIIHRTRPLLRWLFSLRTGLAPRVRNAVLGAMTHMHDNPQGRQALQAAARIARFEPLTADDRADLADWRPLLMQVVTAQ
jgi:phosphonate transport system substrate-binding protein